MNLTKIKMINIIMLNLSQSNFQRREKKTHASSQHLSLPRENKKETKLNNFNRNRQNKETQNQLTLQIIRH